MTRQLEADLRAALAQHASEVPPGAGERLRQVDYHPRSRRMRPPIAVGALAGAAGTAAVAASVVGLGAGASSAFAGWTPSPTPASASQTAEADAACAARLRTLPNGGSVSDLKPVLTDTRGPFTVVIFAGPGGHQSCISSPAFTALSAAGATGESSGSMSGSTSAGRSTVNVKRGSDSTTLAAGKVTLATMATTVRDGQAYTMVEGRTGPGVTATTLVLADGRHVRASTANGWLAAWWPGAQDASAALVATPGGVTTVHLDTGGPVLCGSGPCTRPPAAAGSATVTGGTGTGAQGGTGSGPVTGNSGGR